MATKIIPHWIDGKPYERAAERHGDVFNPATGEVQAKVAFATPAIVDEAVESAARSRRRPGARSSIAKRTKILFAFRELVDQHQHELATLLTLEHGKVTGDALGEVNARPRGDRVRVRHRRSREGRVLARTSSTEVDSYSIRQPLGVVAGITPFNFPAMVPMWMYPIAIACGNTFILKPSASAIRRRRCFCAQLLAEAGLPPRRVQRRARRQGRGRSPARAPDVAAVSFVGSTPIAQYIYETGTQARQARAGARRREEPHDRAARRRHGARGRRRGDRRGYGSAGERCMAISVVVAVGDAADRLVPLLRERIAKLKVGDGLEPGIEMGPLVTRAHLERVARLRRRGRRRGRDARRRRPRAVDRGQRERLLPRAVPVRPRHAGDVDLQGRDLRPGARRRRASRPTTRRSRW